MEEMGRRFAGSLVLSDREAKGLKIGGRAAQAAARISFLGSSSCVPFRYRIPEVAVDIGGMVGEFLEVTSDADGNCFGSFSVSRNVVLLVTQPGFVMKSWVYKGKTDSQRPFSLKLRAEMDLHGNRLGARVSRGGNDIERRGRTEVYDRVLQLEGPTQDTASSPVKSVSQKNSNHEVVPVKISDAHIRLRHLEELMAENEKLLHMEEDKGGVDVTLCSSAKLDATVNQTAKKTRKDGSSLDIKSEEILRLVGAVMRATFDNPQTMERNVSLSGIIDHERDVVQDVKGEDPVLAMKFSVGCHKAVVDKDKKEAAEDGKSESSEKVSAKC
ncbi:hypothetical protein M0R45_015007 [Rubus argutus]|uniref:Uncharacterized protein n=1 Tax=Rubus argutus TaxID=59490 RepID=A0AAW1XNW7_RUBAR